VHVHFLKGNNIDRLEGKCTRIAQIVETPQQNGLKGYFFFKEPFAMLKDIGDNLENAQQVF
jgi:hypothetical protein